MSEVRKPESGNIENVTQKLLFSQLPQSVFYKVGFSPLQASSVVFFDTIFNNFELLFVFARGYLACFQDL